MNQEVIDKIQRRRLQMLINSRIYYVLDSNIISDKQWDEWAQDLVELQKRYPDEAKAAIWHEAFKDWDASTGAFLPLNDPWVVTTADHILKLCGKHQLVEVKQTKAVKSTGSARKKLF